MLFSILAIYISIFSIVIPLLIILSIVVPLLISVAYFTIAERKIMGAIQRRKGPNNVGFIGGRIHVFGSCFYYYLYVEL